MVTTFSKCVCGCWWCRRAVRGAAEATRCILDIVQAQLARYTGFVGVEWRPPVDTMVVTRVRGAKGAGYCFWCFVVLS